MSTITSKLGDAPVTIRFNYEPGCLGHGAHPDADAYAEIYSVTIGGIEVGPTFLAPEWVIAQEVAIVRRLHEDAKEAAWERQEEALAERGYP